jgi:hypothetical protein
MAPATMTSTFFPMLIKRNMCSQIFRQVPQYQISRKPHLVATSLIRAVRRVDMTKTMRTRMKKLTFGKNIFLDFGKWKIMTEEII